jgi:hypothetical protein
MLHFKPEFLPGHASGKLIEDSEHSFIGLLLPECLEVE